MINLTTIMTILSIISTICAIVFAYVAFSRTRKRDDTEEGQSKGAVLTEMGYIKSGIDDIKRKQERQAEKQETQYVKMTERLTSVEESAKQAHKRLDLISNKVLEE